MKNFVRFCLRTFFTCMKVKCNIAFDENKLPTKAVYVSNHVSYLDPIILFAFLPGDPVFALNGHLYRSKWIRFLMRTADIMPFNPIEPMDIKELIAKVDSGRRCVIFAEGRITENGGLMKIYEAPGLVADKSHAPIVPVWIAGPQYGYFSKTKGRLPHRPLPKIRITVKAPVKFKLKDELRRQRDHISNEVYMIMREMSFEASYNDNISLFGQLMKTAKVHSKKGCCAVLILWKTSTVFHRLIKTLSLSPLSSANISNASPVPANMSPCCCPMPLPLSALFSACRLMSAYRSC